MIIMFGTRLYGKVDHVPGLFYVATNFAYLQFVPLVPTVSYLILDGTEGGQGFKGVKIPMSGKSIFIAYLRAALMVGGIALAGVGIAEVGRHLVPGAVMIGLGVLAILMFIASYRLTRPGASRALRLAAQAGIPPEVVAKYFVHANLVSEQLPEPEDYHPYSDRRNGDHDDAHEDDYRRRRSG